MVTLRKTCGEFVVAIDGRWYAFSTMLEALKFAASNGKA